MLYYCLIKILKNEIQGQDNKKATKTTRTQISKILLTTFKVKFLHLNVGSEK